MTPPDAWPDARLRAVGAHREGAAPLRPDAGQAQARPAAPAAGVAAHRSDPRRAGLHDRPPGRRRARRRRRHRPVGRRPLGARRQPYGGHPADRRTPDRRRLARLPRSARRPRRRRRPVGQAPGDARPDHALRRRSRGPTTVEVAEARRLYCVLATVHGVFDEFRSPFFGRSGVQLWWGGFDLAVLLFSGAQVRAPEDRGYIMRYDLDAEHLNAGFWPGSDDAPAGHLLRLHPPAPAGLRDGSRRARRRRLGRGPRPVGAALRRRPPQRRPGGRGPRLPAQRLPGGAHHGRLGRGRPTATSRRPRRAGRRARDRPSRRVGGGDIRMGPPRRAPAARGSGST